MEFSRKKLPAEAAADLRLSPISSVQPYVAMPAPVYVLLRANQKFVAVKGPLDYFTPEELKRLGPMESFFFTEFIDQVLDFRDAGRKVRRILSWTPQGGNASERELTPHEVSDAILRVIGGLWTPLGIESLFVSVFVTDLCDPLPGAILEEARDRDVDDYEKRLLRSSWLVFLALHLGYCNLGFLNSLRDRVFREGPLERPFPVELASLARVVSAQLEATAYRGMESAVFTGIDEPVARKVASRISRIEREFMKAGASAPTIYGPMGFMMEGEPGE